MEKNMDVYQDVLRLYEKAERTISGSLDWLQNNGTKEGGQPPDAEAVWKQFAQSGSISDYLSYTACTKEPF